MIWLLIPAFLLVMIIVSQDKGVPVLLFHQVNHLSSAKPEVVRNYFKFLKKHKYHTLTMTEVDAIRKAGTKLPLKSVIITFDDGYYDNYSIVYPIMLEFNIKATFFINTLFIKDLADRSNTNSIYSDKVNDDLARKYFAGEDCTSDQYMTWQEMKEMQQSSLADFQCHSHKHGMVFSNFVIKDVITNNNFSSGTWHVYKGKPEIGFPVFKMRGETSVRMHTVSDAFLKDFQAFYIKNLTGIKKSKRVRMARNFMSEQNQAEITTIEKEQDYTTRIQQELSTNRDLLIQHLDTSANAYAWPYGHKNQQAIPALKKAGITYFLTCKKGTNNRILNADFIYRIEPRKYTFSKLKWFTRINSNLFLGTLYRYIS